MRLPPDTSAPGHRRTDYYGAFAFGSVILTCFLQFAYTRQLQGSVWQLAATFLLGALYGALGILQDGIVLRHGQPWRSRIFLVMLAVVTVLLFVSPVRGFFAIIVLPLVSQAIFDYPWQRWLMATLYCYALTIAVLVYYYGTGAVPEALMSYLAAFAFTIAFTLITRRALDARDRELRLRQELEEANTKLRAAAAQTEELATTRERNRLAREIHDGVGHYLTVVKTQLDAAAALMPTQPERARATIEKAAQLAADALDDVRRSVGTLRTDAARPPLSDAVRQLAAHGAPAPMITIEGSPRPLPPAVEHALFRAAQEGLTNIRKHARATNALLVLDYRHATRVRLELADNGVGASTPPAASGYGLTGLRERIALLGGTVEAANRLEGGFTLRVEVPA